MLTLFVLAQHLKAIRKPWKILVLKCILSFENKRFFFKSDETFQTHCQLRLKCFNFFQEINNTILSMKSFKKTSGKT